MSTASLAGGTVSRVRVQVPAWGVWWADVDLTSEVELARGDAETLSLADVTLTGTVVDGGAADGRAAYRIAGGAGGWGQTVEERGYLNDAGVSADTVVGDVAREVGETVEGVTGQLSRHYTRAAEPASAVLHRLYPRGWYVDFAGVTQIGQRATTEYEGTATRTRRAPGSGVIELVTTEIATLVPGVTVDGSDPATDVEYVLDAGRLTVRVYAGTRPARRLEAWARIVEALDPHRRYRGVYEYRVVSETSSRLNLQVVRAATGLPDLRRVPVCGPYGVRSTVTPGALVKVAFTDNDPARPFIIAGPAWDDPGWLPSKVQLGGSGEALALASAVETELGDLVTAITNAAVLAGDGGAAFKSNLLLQLQTTPPPAGVAPWPGSVGSARVEADS